MTSGSIATPEQIDYIILNVDSGLASESCEHNTEERDLKLSLPIPRDTCHYHDSRVDAF